MTGMFVYQLSFLPHLGHFEGGNTMLSPLKPLNAATFKKLPMQRPIAALNIVKRALMLIFI